MIYKHGSYSHSEGEVRLTVRKGYDLNPRGGKLRENIEHTISGRLRAASGTAVNSAIAALEAAYAISGVTSGLYFADGSPTKHVILQNDPNLIRGPESRQINYDQSGNAQFSFYRDYNITVTAMRWATGTDTMLDFSETLSFTGGLRSFGVLSPVDGSTPIVRRGSRSVYQARQQGTAVSRNALMTVPPPLFGFELMSDYDVGPPTALEVMNGRVLTWRYAWSYSFLSPEPLSGTSTVR